MASKSGPSTRTSSRTAAKRPATDLLEDKSKRTKKEAPDLQSAATAEQFASLADIKPSHNAGVHGVLLDLSPVKKSKNDCLYFEGHLADHSKRPVRFVGFSNSQHSQLSALHQEKQPIALLGCEVKPDRQGEKDTQIFLNKSSIIQHSPRKLDPQECQPPMPEYSKLQDLKDKPSFHHLSTRAKAISVHKPIVVTGGKKKQDIIIADATATASLTLWEENVDRIIEGNTYSFNNLIVKTFRDKKQLSAPRNATITTDDDMTDVASESSDSDSEDPMTLRDVQVIGVPLFSSYTACIICKAKVEPKSANIGYCTKCSMPQRLDKCVHQLSAKVIVQAGTLTMQKTLHVFGPQLAQMTGKPEDQITVEAVLMAAPFNIRYNQRQVITSVYWNV